MPARQPKDSVITALQYLCMHCGCEATIVNMSEDLEKVNVATRSGEGEVVQTI